MTRQDIINYKKAHEAFVNACKAVCEKKRTSGEPYAHIKWANLTDFKLTTDGKMVLCSGIQPCGYTESGTCPHYEQFDVIELAESNEEFLTFFE